jgi:beta-RFAP synthase
MISVHTASRLHFGLLNISSDDRHSLPLSARRFGGVGLMVHSPGVHVRAERTDAWSAEGSLGARALEFASRLCQSLPAEVVRPLHLAVSDAPEHMGLGTGTQLALAVGCAVTAAFGLPRPNVAQLAAQMGRGARSAVGIHGFAHGGFIVEGGKRRPENVSPLVVRCAFPDDWRVVLVQPPWERGLSGEAELAAFHDLQRSPPQSGGTGKLCRIVLLGILPALGERNLDAFGEAVQEFNFRVGEAFAHVQGGPYASPKVAELIAHIRRQGVPGVGQSSWGPSVFALVEDEDRGRALVQAICTRFSLSSQQVLTTAACNVGARIEAEP